MLRIVGDARMGGMRWPLTLLVIFAGLLVACGGYGAAPGRIAFMSDRDGNLEIYVMNADGSGQTNLTNNPADDFLLAWPPDGRRIAFVSDRDGDREIYLMDADGSKQINLTRNPADEVFAVWSPSGERIAFMSDRDGNWEIYVMNADGSNQTRLTNSPAVDMVPSWSPDGNRIVFTSNGRGAPDANGGTNSDLYVINADGSGLVRLTGDAVDEFGAAWSLDGLSIAFISGGPGGTGIFLMSTPRDSASRQFHGMAGLGRSAARQSLCPDLAMNRSRVSATPCPRGDLSHWPGRQIRLDRKLPRALLPRSCSRSLFCREKQPAPNCVPKSISIVSAVFRALSPALGQSATGLALWPAQGLRVQPLCYCAAMSVAKHPSGG